MFMGDIFIRLLDFVPIMTQYDRGAQGYVCVYEVCFDKAM